MTTIQALENKAADLAGRAAHAAKLIAALAPDPREWDYTGNVYDTGQPDGGKCACGHPIRYLYELERKRDSRTAIVGSTCVDHFADLAPELCEVLRAAVRATEEKIAEAKAAAKRAAALETVAVAREAWLAEKARYRALCDAHRDPYSGRIPRNLWDLGHYYCEFLTDQGKHRTTPAGQRKWYEKAAAVIRGHLDR